VVDEVAGKWLSVKSSAADKHRIGNIPLRFDGKRNSVGKVARLLGRIDLSLSMFAGETFREVILYQGIRACKNR
jgi:hypothetical protein